MALSIAMPSLAALCINDLDTGAPKRKAPSSSGSHQGHYGLASDSSAPVRMVVLSRLMRARDDPILETAARGAIGAGVLHGLRGSVLRVAVAAGGADPSLTDAQVTTFFNLSASHVASQRLYGGGLSLPSKLPWKNAKALLSALLGALSSALATESGAQVAALLLQSPPPPSMDQAAIAVISKLVAAVETTMTAMISGGDVASSSSSARSSPPALPALPPFPPAVGPSQPSVVAVEAFSIAPARSFLINVERLVAAQLARPLDQTERNTIASAMEEALSVLLAGGAETRRQLLAEPMLNALAMAGMAQLWASCLEAADGGVVSVDVLAREVVDSVTAVSAAIFTAAIGV